MVAKAGVAKDKAHELLSILALRVRVELWEGAAMLAVKLKAECIPTPEGSVSRRQAGVWPVAARCHVDLRGGRYPPRAPALRFHGLAHLI
jgi:ribosomal protein L37AE/L43A